MKKIDHKLSKAESIILTIKEQIEVLITVKVHTGVPAAGVIISGWESSLD